ncbi:DUF3866 family protein [Paenibacillus sp. MBLB4367]|uniref:DUF3866 family protein n=1 Tax=Paenibacillus sp. MBLB4367 TaxID=3384767 RepID=UPI0039081437
MIDWAKGRVVHCRWLEHRPVQELRVALEGGTGEVSLAYHYTDVLPPVTVGDRVMINRTAVKLKLGTGGIDFVCAVLEQNPMGKETAVGADGLPSKKGDGGPDKRAIPERNAAENIGPVQEDPEDSEKGDLTGNGGIGQQQAASGFAKAVSGKKGEGEQKGGRMMKLRYTPVQRAVYAVEEEGGLHHGLFRGKLKLEGMPVLIGGLHSMLPVALSWLRYRGEQAGGGSAPSVAYVMTDGGALPLAVSHHAAVLRGLGWLCGTVTAGHAYGGDLEAMNKYSALLAAKHVLRADIAIACMGPGSAGTGTRLGHTAVEVAELVHAVNALGGIPIVMPRLSFADARERHYGLSHHIVSALGDIALSGAILPLPGALEPARRIVVQRQLERSGCDKRHQCLWIDGVIAADAQRAIQRYPQAITTMGRGLRDDPSYFLGVCAAAEHAFRQLAGFDAVPAAPSAERGGPSPG